MSTASSKSVDQKNNAEVSKVGEEGTSSASPSTSTAQQQTAGDPSVAEEAIFCPPAALIHHQNAGPSNEDQLHKQIARLEDDIHQVKLDQGPNREAVKHTLLLGELAQVREENLNLRVELQVAQESVQYLEKKLGKHQVLGSELERCKHLMQKAIDDLSTGLELSNNKSPNLGLAAKAVPFDASLLPQQSVSSGPVATATRVSNPFGSNRDTSSSTSPTSSTDTSTPINFGTFDQPPSRPSQGLTFPPRVSQTDGRKWDTFSSTFPTNSTNTNTSNIFGTLGHPPSRASQVLSPAPSASKTGQPPTVPPFLGTSSASSISAFHPLATKVSSAVASTAAGFPDSPQVYNRYGDTGKPVQQENDGGPPHWQNQSFEEARLRHYEHYHGKPETELEATPKFQGTSGKFPLGSTRAPDVSTLFGGSSTSQGLAIFRANQDSKPGKHSGVRMGKRGG